MAGPPTQQPTDPIHYFTLFGHTLQQRCARSQKCYQCIAHAAFIIVILFCLYIFFILYVLVFAVDFPLLHFCACWYFILYKCLCFWWKFVGLLRLYKRAGVGQQQSTVTTVIHCKTELQFAIVRQARKDYQNAETGKHRSARFSTSTFPSISFYIQIFYYLAGGIVVYSACRRRCASWLPLTRAPALFGASHCHPWAGFGQSRRGREELPHRCLPSELIDCAQFSCCCGTHSSAHCEDHLRSTGAACCPDI